MSSTGMGLLSLLIHKDVMSPRNAGFLVSAIHYSAAEAYHCVMRIVLGLVAMGLLLVESGGIARPAGGTDVVARANVATSSASKARVDFDTQVKPIFKSKCMPCHFSGGQMYDRLPFDKPETIRKLGTRVFTRIKEEDNRRLIEDFLTQAP
jgi:hypothetical protein